jgi:hypothetical protein
VNDDEQSKFYSDIFRNINTGGTKLTRLESRKSLYFLRENLKDFFVPAFLDGVKVETSSRESGLMDFVKYLSILSQYKGNNNNLSKYGGRVWEKNEDYYKKYIMAVVNKVVNNELSFDISYPSTIVPKGTITATHFSEYDDERMKQLHTSISQLDIPKSYNSIIDMDIYFFGLVNEIVFLDNKLDETNKDKLKTELDDEIKRLKSTENHQHNPNALKYLKSRISASIEIYKKYRVENEKS